MYFYAITTTIYDGFEFTDKSLIQAESEEEARKQLSKQGIVIHDDTEEIERIDLKELTKVEYEFLNNFI